MSSNNTQRFFQNLFVIFFLLLSSSNAILLRNSKTQLNDFNKNSDRMAKGFTAARYASTCMSALTNSVPPAFCFKKGADAGVIPDGCPEGFFRSAALCYAYCSPGWKHILGICYNGCEKGYDDHGLTCYKSFFHWYFKSSYIPESITNFSDRVPCPGDMYKSLALCYRDCNHIGMANCGIGACSSDSTSCIMEIGNMLMSVGEGILTAITTIASFGTASLPVLQLNPLSKKPSKPQKEWERQLLNLLRKLLQDNSKTQLERKQCTIL